MGVWAEIKSDAERCGPWPRAWVRDLLLTTGAPALLGYRLRRRLTTASAGLVPRPIKIALAVAVQVLLERRTNVDLPSSVPIGPGCYIPHVGYVVVSSHATLGSHCTLCQGITIGHAGGASRGPGSPVIGDRVYIGPGAMILGPINIGDDCLIAPGAIVTRSAPARSVLVGSPARQTGSSGAFSLIAYPGCDVDVDRLNSIRAMEQSNAAADGRHEEVPADPHVQ